VAGMRQLQVTHEDDILRAGHVDNLVVAGWWNAPTPDHVRILSELSVPIHDRSKGMGFVNVINLCQAVVKALAPRL